MWCSQGSGVDGTDGDGRRRLKLLTLGRLDGHAAQSECLWLQLQEAKVLGATEQMTGEEYGKVGVILRTLAGGRAH